MDRKPFELIKELKRKNAELENTKVRHEYQIQEMITKSAQKSAQMDQKVTKLEIKIRDLEHEVRSLKHERRELKRKIENNSSTLVENFEVIELDSNDERAVGMEEEDEEVSNLLIPISSLPRKKIVEKKKRNFACNLCSKTYVYEKRLEIHKFLKHKESSARNVAAPNKKTKFYTCNFYTCDYSTPNSQRFCDHMAAKHGANLTNDDIEGDNLHDEGIDEEQFTIVSHGTLMKSPNPSR